MDEIVREPCPRCGEPAAVGGRICPHCGGSLLVDVSADRVPDARTRYRIARELIGLGAPFDSLSRIQQSLDSGGALQTQITRESAAAALSVLDRHAVRGRTSPSVAAAPEIDTRYEEVFRPPLFRERLLFVLPLAATAAVLWLLFHSGRRPSPRASATAASPTAAAESVRTPEQRALSPRELAIKGLDSTASLTCGRSSGSGFFVAPDLLVTNDHVLGPSGGAAIQVSMRDGGRLSGIAEVRDDWLDLALVRVPGARVKPLLLGDATAVVAGDVCLMIGNPMGMDFTVTEAIISHNARSVFGIAYLQFDANVNPGNSGGPLLASDGRSIGIVSMAVVGARGLGLALPVNYLFETQSARVPLPLPAPDFPAWRSLLRQVRDRDERDVADARAALDKPGLAGAAVSPAGELVVAVALRGMPSGALPFRFDLFRGEQLLCSPTAIVESWDPFETARRRSVEDPRRARWLAHAGLADQLYVGTAALRIEGCPDVNSLIGAQLYLRSADPTSDRVVVRSMPILP
jgi:serine protease Do